MTVGSLGMMVAAGMLVLASSDGFADTAKSGRELHDANCLSCHDSSVYQREDRTVNSMEELKTQIRRCEMTLDLTWSDTQLNSVADYLNREYYKFK